MRLPHDIHVLPRPTHVEALPGQFTFTPSTALRIGPGAEPAARLLRDLLAAPTGLALNAAPDGRVDLIADAAHAEHGPEGYAVTVTPDAVRLEAANSTGLLHAAQTLRQLLPSEVFGAQPAPGVEWTVPCVRITDAPRLPWRGAMIDVARHFQPVEFLYRFTELLAMHKINVLHLHLTDDQGWRMPIAAYPKLTEIGSRRAETTRDGVPHGGAYTRAELAGVIDYAAARGITVVPEIEMPGHAQAALAAYPELGNHPDRALDVWTRWGVSEHIFGVHDLARDFCRTVIDEVMDLFPSRYLHLGGDECPLTEWATSSDAAACIREYDLDGPADLYRWFMSEAGAHVIRAGRQPVAWAEDDLTLPSSFTVQPWRDESHGWDAVTRGHDVIMTPHLSTYLNYAASTSPHEPESPDGAVIELPRVQAFTPVPTSWPSPATERVLGTQAQLWTEHLPTSAHIEYQMFPRLCAIADSAWAGHPDAWDPFMSRLDHHRRRLDLLGVPRTAPTAQPTT